MRMRELRRSPLAERFCIGGLLVAAFGLRLYRLGDANLWWDEALAVWAARKGLVGVTLWTAGDVHPPLYFWSLWAWMSVAGESETVVRLVSVGYGLLLLLGVWLVGRRVGGPIGGGAALVLAAISRFAITWSMELRMYVGAGAMLTLAAYAALRWIDRPGKRWLAAYVVFAVAATHFIYLAAAGVAAVNVAVLVTLTASRSDRRFGQWLMAQAAVATLHIPWLTLALPRMSSWRSVVEPAAPGFVVELYATLLATGVSTDLGEVTTLTVAFTLAAVVLVATATMSGMGDVAGAGWSVWQQRRSADPTASHARVGRSDPGRLTAGGASAPDQHRYAAALLASFVVIPPLAVWAATQPRSIFYSPAVEARYLLPFVAPVYAVLGACVGVALRTRRSAGVAKSKEAARSAATVSVDDPSPTIGMSHIGRLLRPPLAAAAFAVMVGVQLVAVPAHYSGRHWKDAMLSMAETIWTVGRPTDVVLLVSGNRYPIARYVYDREPPPGAVRTDLPGRREAIAAPGDRPQLVAFPDEGGGDVSTHDWAAALEGLSAAGNRIWLWEVDSNLQDPDGVVKAWLDANRPLVQSEAYASNRLHLYGVASGQSAEASGDGPDTGAAEVRRLAGTAAETRWPDVWVSQPATSAAGGEVNVKVYGPPQILGSARLSLVTAGGRLLEHVGADYRATAERGAASSEPATGGDIARRRFVIDLGDRAVGGKHALHLASRLGAADIGRLRVAGRGAGEWVDWGITVQECCEWSDHSPSTEPAARTEGDARTDRSAGAASPAAEPVYRLRLTGAGRLPRFASAGTRMPIDLEWQFVALRDTSKLSPSADAVHPDASGGGAGNTPDTDTPVIAIEGELPTVFVHLLGPPRPDGSITWSTADGPPSFGDWHLPVETPALDRHWLDVPGDASPGEYSVEVGLYYPVTGERLRLSGDGVEGGADRIIIGRVTVR